MRLTERDLEAVITALEQLPTPVGYGWGWWIGIPRQSLDQYELLAILQAGGPIEGLALHPAVSLAVARGYGKLDRLTAWHLHCADDDLCRSIPEFRRKLHADPVALAEELRRVRSASPLGSRALTGGPAMGDEFEEGTWQAAWPSTVPDAEEIAAEVQRLTPYAAQYGVYQSWLHKAIESARGGMEIDRNDADYWLEKLREQEELDRNRGKAWV